MQTRSHQPWGVRLGTLAIWALAAASAAYWGLRLTARPPVMHAPTAAPAAYTPRAAEPAPAYSNGAPDDFAVIDDSEDMPF